MLYTDASPALSYKWRQIKLTWEGIVKITMTSCDQFAAVYLILVPAS